MRKLKYSLLTVTALTAVSLSNYNNDNVVFANDNISQILSNIDEKSDSSLNDGISKLENQITETQLENDKLASDIEKLDSELKALSESIIALNEQLKEQAKSAQISNNTHNNFITTLLDSKNLGDALNRITAMNTISSANQKLKDDLETKKVDMESKQKINQEKIKELESNILQLNEAKAELEVLKLKLQKENEARIAEAEAAALEVRELNANVASGMTSYMPPIVPSGANASITSSSSLANKHTGSGNMYSWGQCTWGVKSLANWVGTYWGNASQWGYSAAAEGFNVGTTPVVGAIIVFNDGGYGHVGYVTDVRSDGMIQIMESNYGGSAYAVDPRGIGNFRGWFNPNSGWASISYIYPPVG